MLPEDTSLPGSPRVGWLGDSWPIEAQHPGSDHYKAAFAFQIPTHTHLTHRKLYE